MSILADRRLCARSEVVGRWQGMLEIAEPARLMNISDTGALIETSMPTAVGSLRSLELKVDGQSARVKVCVRFVTRIGQGPQGPYAMGVEFVSPPEGLTALVVSLIAEARMG
jgi:hypothetical protein